MIFCAKKKEEDDEGEIFIYKFHRRFEFPKWKANIKAASSGIDLNVKKDVRGN